MDWKSISLIVPTVGFQPSAAFSAVTRTATQCPLVLEKGFVTLLLSTSSAEPGARTRYGEISLTGVSSV